ncbi:hypothetical protein VTN77DRAFT_7349 [Rasamsonia byssochlamydoides]|uniref:uncharacterized protein n=1 Tax=Rasamsonia byssochlamydoides TaxID=89139 RepID=UPI003742A5EA
MAALKTAAKKELRRKIQKVLQNIPRESIASQSALATSRLLSLSEYQNAKRISVYLSMPQGEISTTGIVRDALASGKEVFIPYIHSIEAEPAQPKVSVMDMLSLNSMEEFESLTPDKWGIPSLSETSIPTKRNCFGGYGVEPTRPRNPEEAFGLDLIVMPGVAFDINLRRLGHGKGYYDHFLNRYSREVAGSPGAPQKPFLVALALKEQVLPPTEEIPVDEHDWLVDTVIVGNGKLIVPEK